jgi:localization factor PodJL
MGARGEADMSDNGWVLKGVDPETRERAEAEAQRRGVSLGDYLTDIMLQRAVIEQLAADAPPAEDHSPTVIVPPSQENFAVRHRLASLERRFGVAIGGLDNAIHGLDGALFNLGSRVDETQALAADTADTVSRALAEMSGSVATLRKRVADAEDLLGALGEAHEATAAETESRCGVIEARLDAVAQVAGRADETSGGLAAAHEALKYALAEDFSALAQDSAERLAAGLDDMRAAAEAAAEHAEAAARRAIGELQMLRASIEQRLEDTAAETRDRMQAAFADAADRLGALTGRVMETERRAARTADELRAQIAEVEDGAQTALEETAESLRQAGDALAADLRRSVLEGRAALENLHGDLAGEIAEVRELQLGNAARLKLVDAAVAGAASDIAALRENLEARVQDGVVHAQVGLHHAQLDWEARFSAIAARLADTEDSADTGRLLAGRIDALAAHVANGEHSATETAHALEARISALAARMAEAERETGQTRQIMEAEAERIETCTFAALEKLSRDMAAGHVALDEKLVQSAEALASALRQDMGAELSDLRDQHSGALARLRLIDKALGEAGPDSVAVRLARLEAELGDRSIDREILARLARLEHAAANAETEQAVAALQQSVAELSAQLSERRGDDQLAQHVEDLRARLAAHETQAGEAADRLHGVARMMSRLKAQSADAAAQAEERLHKVELALADLRLDTIADQQPAYIEAVQALEQRVGELDARQLGALEQLRADIALFIDANDRRFAALETNDDAALLQDMSEIFSARLSRLEQYDVAAEFDALRRRMDERILGVEQRSVRALEQVAETVAMIERRFAGREDGKLAQSA